MNRLTFGVLPTLKHLAIATLGLTSASACTAQSDTAVAPASSAQGFYLATRKIDEVVDLPSDRAIRTAGVTGVALRIKWNVLQPSENQYDWKIFDAVVRSATAAGRKISVGVVAGTEAPDWLARKGVPIHSFTQARSGCTTETAPEFWHPEYVRAYLKMMQAIKDRLIALRAYDALSIVKITGLSQQSLELRIAVNNRCSDTVDDEWKAAGYRPSRAVRTWKQVADGMARIYPDKLLIQPILQAQGFPAIDENGGRTARRAVNVGTQIDAQCIQGYGGRCGLQWNALKLQGRMADRVLQAHAKGAVIGWQTNLYEGPQNGSGCQVDRRAAAVPCTASTYTQLLERGIDLGATFIEVWEPDVLRYNGALVTAGNRWARTN